MIAVAAMLLVGQPGAGAEMYTWTNADGTVGVTDDLSKVPEKHRGQMKPSGDGEGGTGSINYSKPQAQNPEETGRRSFRQAAAQDHKPLVTMEEQKKLDEQAAEKRKKDEEEIKKTWNNMKKALSGQ